MSTIENITNPGQPLAHRDQYKEIFDNGTFTVNQFIVSTKLEQPLPIRIIATKSWYRRLTQAERINLRTTDNEDINDLREDLQRAPTVDAPRITELLADGTEEERYVNVVT
jgi:hypothetical protein